MSNIEKFPKSPNFPPLIYIYIYINNLLSHIIPALRIRDTSVLNAARVDINLAWPTKFRGKLKRLLARQGTRARRGRIISRNFLRDNPRDASK